MSPRPAPRVPAAPLYLRVLLPLVCALCVSGLARAQPSAYTSQEAPPDVGAEVTQRIDLEPGPNFVSLYVSPESHDLEDLFGDQLDQIFLIKDGEGAVFAPKYGVRDLTEWRWTQAHLVYVRNPVTVEVRGQRIEPQSALPLERGWSWVPYFGTGPMDVEEAFASLGASMTRVEDVDGRTYPEANNAEPLTALQPGRGYRVHLSDAATLVYGAPEGAPPPRPAPPPPPPSERIAAATLADALALRGLEPGQTVEVGGYYAEGDGGGGTFDVTASGAAPDGGTVFVPDEHASGVVMEAHRYRHDQRFEGVPRGEDVVFGSLSLDVLDERGSLWLRIPGHYLHGHAHGLSRTLAPGFFYGDGGRLNLYKARIGRDRTVQYSYRHTTGDVRLERVRSEPVLRVEWFGARPAARGPSWTGSTDVQPILAHVMNVADALNGERSGAVREVRLSFPDVYDTFGSIIVPNGVTLRGEGGTEVQTVTNDLGHTYRPVRVRPRHTRLRTMDGEAFRHIRMLKNSSDPAYLAPDAKFVLKGRPTSLWVGHGVMEAGIEDIVLDGNWENNQQPWTEDYASYAELEEWGRNSPGHAGFVSTNHKGVYIPQGQHLTVRNVAVDGFISNGLLGNANNTWTVENVRLGNSLWNHVLYNANGSYTNLTLHGFAWDHVAWGYGTVDNLVFEDGAVSPTRRGRGMWGIRGGDAHDPADLAGDDGYFTREDGTVPTNFGTTVTGIYLDFREAAIGAFSGLGPNIAIRGVSHEDPARIVTDPGSSFGYVFAESGNGYQRALYPNNVIEHVVLYDLGSKERGGLFGTLNVTRSTYRDIRSDRSLGGTGKSASTLKLNATHRGRPEWDNVQTVTFEEIHEVAPHKFIAKVGVSDDAVGREVTIRRSSFNNTTNTLFRGSNGGGNLAGFKGDPSKLRVAFEDVSLNIHDRYFLNLELFFAMSTLDRVTDAKSGRTSEDGGRASFTGRGGEVFVDVPTELLWRPLDPSFVSVTPRSGTAVKVGRVEVVPSYTKDGDWRAPVLRLHLDRPLRGGEAASFDWSAAVRPPGGGGGV
ncbi:hypothetical protein RQM47_09315 [Rubrivirga sp. S365]|nr:hypothetical protein [Rubrivirga sp. S365]MDT0630547.1 hypothetical protein [Rubrivirga sp. F394]MDT7856838.1 hypothetical protein [Rubrivirga sp. S365]